MRAPSCSRGYTPAVRAGRARGRLHQPCHEDPFTPGWQKQNQLEVTVVSGGRALAVLTASLYTSQPLSNLPQPKFTDDGWRNTRPVSREKNLTVRASAWQS